MVCRVPLIGIAPETNNQMTVEREYPSLLRCCIDAARTAGQYAVEHRPRSKEIHERFSHDVKLALDHECQARATEMILGHYPADSIVGEEGSQGRNGRYEWIVDPIDGTVNYFHGLSWWCCSVAVRFEGEIIAGAVYAPEQNMLFEAHRNAASLLNGSPISGSSVEKLADALVVTGSEKEMSADLPPLATAQTMAPHVQKIRILGAAALDLCQVACGTVDLFCQKGLYIWDVAAAGLIVRQAGGVYRQEPTAKEGRYACLAGANEALVKAFVDRFPDL